MRTETSQMIRLVVLTITLILCSSVAGDEKSLEQRFAELETRIAALEAQLNVTEQIEEPWKNSAIWQSIQNGMSEAEVEKLLGEPSRIVHRVFTTWYYHPKSELHAFVWFDEGKVLGWEPPAQERRKAPSFLNRE